MWTKFCPHKDEWQAAKLDTLALCSCAYPALRKSVRVRVWKSNALLRRHHCGMVVASIWRKSACVGYRPSRRQRAAHVRSAGKLVWRVAASEGVSESCSASVHRSAFCSADDSVAVTANEPSCEITRATASSLPFSALVTTRSRLSAPSKEFLPNYQLYIPVDRCTSSTLKWYISFFLKFIFLNLIIFI
jgi:hypothetical protein